MGFSKQITEIEKDNLVAEALKASEKAYAPYSNFKVGAALLTENGNVFLGCNVENVSYGLTICAERNAVFTAVQNEGPEMKIIAIAVLVNHQTNASLCGGCRQVVSEFAIDNDVNQTIVIFKHGEKIITKTINEILPNRFKF